MGKIYVNGEICEIVEEAGGPDHAHIIHLTLKDRIELLEAQVAKLEEITSELVEESHQKSMLTFKKFV